MASPILPAEEAKRLMPASGDLVGTVYGWGDRIFRRVLPEHRESVERLFQSGLVDALHERNLLVRSWVSEMTWRDGGLLIEHERVPFVTYPHEWTFSMLADAARCVIEVNEIALSFGYELHDCHGYNVLFHHGTPRFCDLGSFQPRIPGITSWAGVEQFHQTYLYPLIIWSRSDSFLARQLMFGGSVSIPHHSFLGWKSQALRRLGFKRRESLARWRFRWEYLDRILQSNPRVPLSAPQREAAQSVLRMVRRSTSAERMQRLRRLVDDVPAPRAGSEWGGYQDSLFEQDEVRGGPRFARIAEIVRRAAPETVIDLAGNSGAFLLSQHAHIAARHLCCVDYDDLAVDRFYLRARQTGLSSTTACLNFVNPRGHQAEVPMKTRLRADVACALAVTHHLVLRQGMDLSHVLSVIGELANRTVIVEFMPLGLFDGTKAPPLPAWYSLAWFREAFHRRFHSVHEEVLESNRIVFVGEKPAA